MPARGNPSSDAEWHRHGMRSPAEIARLIAVKVGTAVDGREVRYEDFIADSDGDES